MFDSVLIANRGEIAVRIARTARRLGMRVVAVHSEADARAPHVRLADEAYPIGPAPARESYLRGERIIEAALRGRAACIHPGYGFLSENADFAEACSAAGLAFVGPPPAAIRAMGLKDAAKALAERAGVPVVPGYHGARQEADFLRRKAYEIGYPVLIKAVAGGGGKGMRRVDQQADFDASLESAQREAAAAFGDPRILVEKYVLQPRHVEIQVFADGHGNVVQLFERDCSLQRRHQKVIEEAPAPGMTPEVREAMGLAAVGAARAVGYVGAGTVEFIADGRAGLREGGFFFMEMNTRLQVEHPVTEAVTGLDLVELQFRVAAGERLPFRQEEVRLRGHAVEARLYAEDPRRGFLPSTGRLWALRLPSGEGVRVDSGVEEGCEVTPHYDPMIAKVIAHAATREEALDRLAAALAETIVAGPATNAAFLRALALAPSFRAGAFDTGFIEANLEALGAAPGPVDLAAVAAGAAMLAGEAPRRREAGAAGAWVDAWDVPDGFSLMPRPASTMRVLADGKVVDVALPPAGAPDGAFVVLADDAALVIREGRQTRVERHDPFSVDPDEADLSGAAVVTSPMHGRLIALFVQRGDAVAKGQRLAIVEAMKMEHLLTAPRDGIVQEVSGEPGGQVAQGARLVTISEAG